MPTICGITKKGNILTSRNIVTNVEAPIQVSLAKVGKMKSECLACGEEFEPWDDEEFLCPECWMAYGEK